MGLSRTIGVSALVSAILLAGCSTEAGGPAGGSLGAPPTTGFRSAAELFVTTLPPLGDTAVVPLDPVPSVVTVPATAPPAPPGLDVDTCSAAPRLPGEALEFVSVRADLDGDAAPDTVTSYGMPTADGLMRWRIRLETAAGVASDLELVEAYAPFVRVLGGVQVDARPAEGVGLAEEVLVALGRSATGVNLGVLGADERGCVFQFGDGTGGVAYFTAGASALRHDGLRCELTAAGLRLVQLSATSTDGLTFVTADTTIQRAATNLVPETVTDGTASLDGPSLFAYSLVDCPGITAL